MFDSDDYFHASDWTIRITEISMIHWNLPDEHGLRVQITHKHGLRFLKYANPKDLDAIERLKDLMDYPYDLPKEKQ